MLFALLYSPDEGQEALLAGLAVEYVDKCAQYLYAVVSCYIGEAVHVPSLRACVQQLAEMEWSTLGQTGSVFRLNLHKQPGTAPPGIAPTSSKEDSLRRFRTTKSGRRSSNKAKLPSSSCALRSCSTGSRPRRPTMPISSITISASCI